MHISARFSMVLLMVAAIAALPTGVMAYSMDSRDTQIEAGAMTADVLVARPLGIVATVGGFGIFVLSAPFSLLGRNVGQAWNALVVYPARFTFARPLGDFD